MVRAKKGWTPTLRYRAFLSYSHRDAKAAGRLHRWLENLRLPSNIPDFSVPVKRVDRRLTPVFKDIEELSAGESLPEQIETALQNSECLVVLCSPDAAKSTWVKREIAEFRLLAPGRPILPVLVTGALDDAVPAELLTGGGEVLAADLREGDFERQCTKLVAGMIGAPFDGIWRRRKRQLAARRFRIGAIAAAALFALLGSGGVAAYVASRNVAIQIGNVHTSAGSLYSMLNVGLSADQFSGRISEALIQIDRNIRSAVGEPVRAHQFTIIELRALEAAGRARGGDCDRARLISAEVNTAFDEEVGLLTDIGWGKELPGDVLANELALLAGGLFRTTIGGSTQYSAALATTAIGSSRVLIEIACGDSRSADKALTEIPLRSTRLATVLMNAGWRPNPVELYVLTMNEQVPRLEFVRAFAEVNPERAASALDNELAMTRAFDLCLGAPAEVLVFCKSQLAGLYSNLMFTAAQVGYAPARDGSAELMDKLPTAADIANALNALRAHSGAAAADATYSGLAAAVTFGKKLATGYRPLELLAKHDFLAAAAEARKELDSITINVNLTSLGQEVGMNAVIEPDLRFALSDALFALGQPQEARLALQRQLDQRERQCSLDGEGCGVNAGKAGHRVLRLFAPGTPAWQQAELFTSYSKLQLQSNAGAAMTAYLKQRRGVSADCGEQTEIQPGLRYSRLAGYHSACVAARDGTTIDKSVLARWAQDEAAAAKLGFQSFWVRFDLVSLYCQKPGDMLPAAVLGLLPELGLPSGDQGISTICAAVRDRLPG